MELGKREAGSAVPLVLPIYKMLGETPLECLTRFRVCFPEYADLPMTYAGRLDPMAEGLLLILAGEECKNKEKYLALEKEYIFEILVGFHTDTHDLLGLVDGAVDGEVDGVVRGSVEEFEKNAKAEVGAREFEQVLTTFLGSHEQKYPLFSSKTVGGVPLHMIARDILKESEKEKVRGKIGEIDEENLPSRMVKISEIEKLSERKISMGGLEKEIRRRVALIKGDFRQEKILEKWGGEFGKIREFQIIKCRMLCSSGTYVRALVHSLSKKLGIPMCTFSIFRSRLGSFTLCSLISLF
ncbi:MAG: hypothetical protein NTV72_02635 [Candidatus Taylorbacteria bacterium]|nr:hypothetical protein [Candidatus Taylorbacteria bacterium]